MTFSLTPNFSWVSCGAMLPRNRFNVFTGGAETLETVTVWAVSFETSIQLLGVACRHNPSPFHHQDYTTLR